MHRRPQSLRNLLLGTFLMLGALIVGGFVLAWVVGVYESMFPKSRVSIGVSFLDDGEPYLSKTIYPGANNNSYTDLEGKPLDEKMELAVKKAQKGIGSGHPATLPAPHVKDIGESLQLPWSSRLIGFADDKRPPTYWYLIHDGLPDGHAYFEGYNSETKRRIGYIGTRGFSEETIPPDERFPLRGGLGWQHNQVFGSGRWEGSHPNTYASAIPEGVKAFQPWEVLLNSGQQIYKVDLANRQVSSVLEQLESPVRMIATSYVYTPRYNTTSAAVRTDDQVIFLHPDEENRRLSLPTELRSFGLEVIERSDGGFTVGASSPTHPRGGMHPEQVFIVDKEGNWGQPREVEVGYESVSGPEPVGVFAVCPPVLMALGTFVMQPYSLMEQRQADNWPDAIRKSWEEMGRYFLLSVFTGAVLAACCYRHQSRYAVGKIERVMWPVFVFLFGLPGWIGYRYHRRWPVVEPCPACQHAAPRDREACATCGREFPAPVLRGTEIFA